MSVYIQTQNRLFIINEFYIMSFTMVIFFAIGRVTRLTLDKLALKRKKSKIIQLANPSGGAVGFEFVDERELAFTILTCIADNQAYLVKDPEIVRIIFHFVKEKIKNQSLVISPNLISYFAARILSKDTTLVAKVGTIVFGAESKIRLLIRIGGSVAIGAIIGLLTAFQYAILMMIIFFNSTENLGYNCNNYFESLPSNDKVSIYSEKEVGNLIITDNDAAHQVEIYVPSNLAPKVSKNKEGQVTVERSYKKSRRKAKQVNFSDFRQADAVLKEFKNLEEPEIEQRANKFSIQQAENGIE